MNFPLSNKSPIHDELNNREVWSEALKSARGPEASGPAINAINIHNASFLLPLCSSSHGALPLRSGFLQQPPGPCASLFSLHPFPKIPRKVLKFIVIIQNYIPPPTHIQPRSWKKVPVSWAVVRFFITLNWESESILLNAPSFWIIKCY